MRACHRVAGAPFRPFEEEILGGDANTGNSPLVLFFIPPTWDSTCGIDQAQTHFIQLDFQWLGSICMKLYNLLKGLSDLSPGLCVRTNTNGCPRTMLHLELVELKLHANSLASGREQRSGIVAGQGGR